MFVYKPSNLIPSQVNIPVKYDSIEAVVLDISFTHHSKDATRVNLFYVPPNAYLSKSFVYLLAQFISDFTSVNYRCCLVGDFNLPQVDWVSGRFPSNSVYSVVCNAMFDDGLHQLNESPTGADNILDLVFVNDPLIVDNLEVGPPLGKRDHNTVMFDLLD